MSDIIINNSNVVINTPPCLPQKKKHFKKMWKVGGWRLYLTHNFRLKNSQTRDQPEKHAAMMKAKQTLWERSNGHCEICGKEIEKFSQAQIHHVLSWWRFPQLEHDTRNLQLLCKDCHKHIHVEPFLECKLIEAKAKELGINLKDYYDVCE